MSTMVASTRNTIGMKTLARQIGMSGLGSGAADAIDAGVDSGLVSTLQALGATDAQLEAVAMDPDSESAALNLLNQLTGNSAVPTPAGLQQQSISQTGVDLTDPASWYDITGQLQQANAALKNLEAQVAANPSIGAQVIQLRNDYTDLSTKWIQAYGTVFGSTPSGLSGLGIAPLILTTAIIATAAVVIAGLGVWWEHYHTTAAIVSSKSTVTTQQTVSQTQQSLINAAQAAAAAGNNALAQQYLAQVPAANAQPSSGATIANWFTSNWQWLAGIAVVMAIGPQLVKKL